MAITKEQIAEKMENSQLWLERGILAIWRYQTDYEKNAETTLENNGVGFNGCDAHFLTEMANWINNGVRRFGKEIGQCLTPKQAAVAGRKMRKYAGQLARIAAENNQ